jgi:hypothetical protein
MQNGITPVIYYCNPNIYPQEEYEIRKNECTRYAQALGLEIVDADYDHENWLCEMKGLEDEPERGGRCLKCFKLRLLRTAQYARERGIKVITTTLASSRWKSLDQINEAGQWACGKSDSSTSLGMTEGEAQRTEGEGQMPEIWSGGNRFDKTLSKRNHQANCIIGGLAPSLYQERERLATVLLCNILGGPANNSILNSVLREKHGWVYGVECGYTQYSDTGIVAISLGCDKSNLDRCIVAIEKEIRRLQENPLSERRLKAAKKQLMGQLAISGDNGETQCLSMGKGLLAYGKITGDRKTKDLVDGITAEDVCEMARIIFAPENLSRLIYI